MTSATVLAGTWSDGLHVLGDTVGRELVGRSVTGLAQDGSGGALAIVDGHAVHRRSAGGEWRELAASDMPLACAVAAGGSIYVGTDDARLLRVGEGGRIETIDGFASVPGRDTWYAGSVVVDGQVLGPPLGVRSMTATSDGAALFVNVHVGGIPRSADGGASWTPTIDVDADVHEVRAHPTRPGVVVAAAAVGLCVSRDGGATWTIEQQGLHATYCSAVALAGDDILVAASADHFAKQGAVYRRPLEAAGPLARVGGGFPEWLDGIADTGCIDARAATVAVADKGGHLHVSADAGQTWSRRADGLAGVSSVLVV